MGWFLGTWMTTEGILNEKLINVPNRKGDLKKSSPLTGFVLHVVCYPRTWMTTNVSVNVFEGNVYCCSVSWYMDGNESLNIV